MKIDLLVQNTRQRGIATVIGIFFFFLFISALFAALSLSLENETTMINTENLVANQLDLIRHEKFIFSDPPAGVCIDPANNRLFVEVDNIGANYIEFADLWIVNKSASDQQAILNQIDYRDSFVPFGQNASLLLNQPIYLDAGTYDIKLVTTLGVMETYPSDGSGFTVEGALGTGDFLGAFVGTQSGGLDQPEGIEFGPDGKLYVSSEDDHKILRYDGTTGAFIDVFADLNPGGGGSGGSGGSGGGGNTCKKPLGMEFGPDGNLYIASENKDVVCKYDGSTGAFIEYFVTDGLGGLDKPADVTFGSDGNLYVSSEDTDQILRYDGTTGAFIDVFINTASGGLDKPKFMVFQGNDLYVSSAGTDEVLRYDKTTGAFVSVFVTSNSGGLDEPEGIRFDDDGNLYVSSEKTNEILLYTPGGVFDKKFVSAGSGGLDEPADLVFGPDGNLYVASEKSDQVLKYDGTGITPGGIPSCPGFTCARGCPGSVGGTNNDLYVSSDDTDEVIRYDGTTGAFVSIFVTSGLGGLNDPSDLTFGPIDDHLYVSSEESDQILRYDGDTGAFIDVFVAAGSGGLDAPEGLLFGTDGNLYVASENSHKILRFDGTTGAFIDVFADLNPGGGGSGGSGGSGGGGNTCKKPLGMEFGPDGNLYIASEDSSMDVICRYDGTTGAFIDYFVTDGLGGLKHPNDVTFGPDGNLYVTGEDNNKVYRYDGSDGSFIDVFSSTGLAKPKFLVFHNSDLYVSSESNDKVVQFDDTSGAFKVNFVDPSDNGGLDKPQGLTFKPDKSTATVPDAPLSLMTTAGNTQVSLSWTVPSSDGGTPITDYIIQYRTTNPGVWITFNDGVGTSTSAVVTGLTNGVSYDFQVAAKNVKGIGAYSSQSGNTSATPVATVPDAPTSLNATAGISQVSLAWTAPASDGGATITDYTVQYKQTSSGTWLTFSDGTSTSTSATVTGLSDGTTYDFQVAAVNSAGTGAYSLTDSATTLGTPGAPSSLIATAGDAQVSLAWTAPASDGGATITDYTVQYKQTSSGTWLTFSDGTSTDTTATVTGLSNSVSYDFRVAAVNSVGTGTYSNTDSSTPQASNTAPTAPQSLAATAGTSQVSLSWSVPADDGGQPISDYIIQYKLTSSGTWLTFSDGTSTSTSATVTGLSGNVSYDFRVAAVNSIGTGAYSSSVSATPIVAPTADFKVQRGELIMNSGSLTATITEGIDFGECTGDCFVTITNTRHWGMGRTSGGGNQNADDVTVWISNDAGLTSTGGDITFSRVGSSNNNRIAWQIVEYIGESGGVNEMKLRDTNVCTMTGSTCTGSVVTVSNASDIAIIITGLGNHDTGRSNYDRCQVTADLNGSNQPIFTRTGSTSVTCEISYSIVEWSGINWSVERVTHVGSSTRTTTESISSIGSLSRGFIFDTQIRLGDDGNTDGISQQGEQVYLSGTTTVTFSKPTYTTSGWDSKMNEVVYVVSNSETESGKKMIVQREQPTDQHNASGGEEESWSRSITALTYDESEVALFGLSTHVDGTGTAFPRGSINALFDPTNSEVDFTQSDSGQENDYAYELVELPRSIKGIPGIPTSLGATPGNTQVSLSWTAPTNSGASAITDYIIQYKLSSSGTWLTFADGTSTSTSAVVTGLTNLSSYDFQVAAVNSVGTGGYSSSASATPTGGETVPGVPTSLNAIPSSEQVSLSWTAPASNGGTPIIDYIIQYKLSSSGTWLTFADGTSTSTSAVVTGLTGGSSYDFHVAAVNLIGTGAYSTTVTATPTNPAPTGTPLGDFATGIDQPNGLTFGPDGNLYVTSRADHEIRKYDGTTGAFISVFADTNPSGSSKDCKKPQDVTFGPDNHMYVSSNENRICKYDGTTGAYISRFVATGSGNLDDPEGLVFGPDGNLYVSSNDDNEILKFNGATGAFMSVFNTSSLIDNPYDLVFDSSGNLYVTNFDDDNVVKITSGGIASVFASSSGNSLEKPWGLAFGPDNNLYVTSYEESGDDNGGVLKFDGTTGAFISEIVPYNNNGGLDEPKGLIFDSSGNFLVSSKDDDRIEKYD